MSYKIYCIDSVMASEPDLSMLRSYSQFCPWVLVLTVLRGPCTISLNYLTDIWNIFCNVYMEVYIYARSIIYATAVDFTRLLKQCHCENYFHIDAQGKYHTKLYLPQINMYFLPRFLLSYFLISLKLMLLIWFLKCS